MAYTFEGRQSVKSHSYKVDTCSITPNILHSAIIIWSSLNLTSGVFPRLPGEQIFRLSPCCCCAPREVTVRLTRDFPWGFSRVQLI